MTIAEVVKSDLSVIVIISVLIHGFSVIADLPPTPPFTPTPESEAGAELRRQKAEAEAYAASLRPSPRVLMEDGRIIKWSEEAIEWFIEAPYYCVQWRASLTEGKWKTIGYQSEERFVHKKADGFYRVLPCKKPTLPPTHPPKTCPTNPPPRTVENTNTNAVAGGFRRKDV